MSDLVERKEPNFAAKMSRINEVTFVINAIKAKAMLDMPFTVLKIYFILAAAIQPAENADRGVIRVSVRNTNMFGKPDAGVFFH